MTKSSPDYRRNRPGWRLSGRFLLNKGYEGLMTSNVSSLLKYGSYRDLYQDPHEKDLKLILHYGDMTDSSSPGASDSTKRCRMKSITRAAQSHTRF